MKDIQIDKNDLIIKLTANRDEHQKTYKAAIKGYREERLKRIRKFARKGEKDPQISVHMVDAKLPMPVDHTEDYDRALDQLRFEMRATIELASAEFEQLVRDNWAWKRDFIATSSTYS